MSLRNAPLCAAVRIFNKEHAVRVVHALGLSLPFAIDDCSWSLALAWPCAAGLPTCSAQGADACAIGGVLQESALMWAARQGYVGIIVELLKVSTRI